VFRRFSASSRGPKHPLALFSTICMLDAATLDMLADLLTQRTCISCS